MSDYRRARGGSTYFFTVVTYKRQPVLCLDDSIRALRAAIREVKEERSFEVKAWVLLPDHLHCVSVKAGLYPEDWGCSGTDISGAGSE